MHGCGDIKCMNKKDFSIKLHSLGKKINSFRGKIYVHGLKPPSPTNTG